MDIRGRSEASERCSSRGQSATLGLVLLIGIVAAGSLTILTIGGQMIGDSEQQAEQERIEQAFGELSKAMATTSTAGDSTEVVDFEAGKHGAIVMTNTSRMTIEYGGQSEDIYFGTIEYEDGDTRIAYQAGGVFRETGNETRIVSSPQIHYDGQTGSETLSFPIIEAVDDMQLNSGEVSISKNSTEVIHSEVVEREFVTIEIEGPYYRGWEQYFEYQAGEGAIDDVDHDNNTVTVRMGDAGVDALYEHAAVTASNITMYGDAGIEGPVLTGDNLDDDDKDSIDADGGDIQDGVDVDLEPIGDEIDDKIEEANQNGWPEVPDDHVTSDKYFEEGNLDMEGTYDLSDGNITLVVDGNLQTGNVDITGIESGNKMYVYTSGKIDSDGGEYICIEDCYDPPGGPHPEGDSKNAKHLEIYGSPSFDIIGGGGNFIGEGVIYAPGAEIGDAGTPRWNGAIMSDSLTLRGTSDLVYDEELEGGPTLHAGGEIPDITYLNVVKHDVDIEE